LRLAVVTPFVDRRHGTERALAELLDRFSREYSCEIHLYAERVDDLLVVLPSSGARANASDAYTSSPHASSAKQSGSITWHRVPGLPGPHLFKFLFWIVANTSMRWWDRIVHGLRFDLVLSPGINCLDADFVVVHALFHRLRELVREQQPQASAPELQGLAKLRQLHRRAYYATVAALERFVYTNRKTRLAAVSLRTANLLNRYFGRNDVSVIFNGIDTVQFSVPARLARRQGARFRRKLSDNDLVLLLIGNDWRVKGLPVVLDAMATAPDLPLRLIVVGTDAAATFQSAAQRLGVADRCRWESPRADVIDFYAAADIYVSPSKEDSFGLPVAEAMACGLPAITSKFAGVSELIHNEHDGFILSDPNDTSALSDLFRRLHADAALRGTIGDAAAVTAQNWTWDRNATEIWKWLQSEKKKS
jgi:glycosyltransferase involved in cell wall biosynthesis